MTIENSDKPTLSDRQLIDKAQEIIGRARTIRAGGYRPKLNQLSTTVQAYKDALEKEVENPSQEPRTKIRIREELEAGIQNLDTHGRAFVGPKDWGQAD